MQDFARFSGRVVGAISSALAFLSGAAFVVLAFYITWEAIARTYGLPYTGVSDEISGYVLAVAGAWGMGYALKVGDHVRIEALTALLPWRLQRILHGVAIAFVAAFAAFLAFYAWRQGLTSAAIDSRGMSALRAPVAFPQGAMAFGLTLLALQAAAMLAQIVLVGPVGEDMPRDDDRLHALD